MPTIREVAKKAGVSSTTVSHVINHTRFVSEDVSERVRSAMDELGYRPNALARSLRRGETKTLGLIMPDSANPFFAEIAKEIEKTVFSSGYSLILCNTNGDLEREKFYTEVLLAKQVDGVIFVAAGDETESLLQLVNRKLPMVVVDRYFGDLPVDIVLTNNYLGGYNATRHLIEQGHRRIAVICGPSNVTPSADRVRGYRSAMQDSGLEVDEELVAAGNFDSESGLKCARQLLDVKTPPTAIFACNDLMAIGAVRAVSENGLRIPEDMALVGFDNIELASYTVPALTTIDQREGLLGKTAGEMLIERIQTPSKEHHRVVIDNQLIIRESSRKIK